MPHPNILLHCELFPFPLPPPPINSLPHPLPPVCQVYESVLNEATLKGSGGGGRDISSREATLPRWFLSPESGPTLKGINSLPRIGPLSFYIRLLWRRDLVCRKANRKPPPSPCTKWRKIYQIYPVPFQWKKQALLRMVINIFHYENTPIQIYRKFYLQKLKLFR